MEIPAPAAVSRCPLTLLAKLIETFAECFGYTDVVRLKPISEPGRDLRDLPIYTIPQAALFLGIAPRTASYWFSPQNDILRPSGYLGSTALLSFRDLTETYVLTLLTKFYSFPLRGLFEIVKNAKRETRLERPLIEADLKVLFRGLILDKPARGKQPRQAIDLAHSRNLVFPQFVDQLGRRILRDQGNTPYRIYPWRLITPTDECTPVSVDPNIVSGCLVVTGTRIPVRVLLGKKHAGRSEEQIAASYAISVEAVRKALLHIERPLRSKAA